MAVSELSWSEIACGLIAYPSERLNYSRSEQNRRKNGFNIYNAVISASGHLKFYILQDFIAPPLRLVSEMIYSLWAMI